MADQLWNRVKDTFWEWLLKCSLIAVNAALALNVWFVKQIYDTKAEVRSWTDWRNNHNEMSEEYKGRIRTLESGFEQFKVTQEQVRGDIRAVDQSVRNIAAQIDLQIRQSAVQQEKIAELREKTANVLVLLDSAIIKKAP